MAKDPIDPKDLRSAIAELSLRGNKEMLEMENIAKNIAKQFERINTKLKSGIGALGEMRNFSNEILKDTKARNLLLNEMEQRTASAESNLIAAKLKRIRLQSDEIGGGKIVSQLEKDRLDAVKKRLTMDNRAIRIGKELVKIDRDIAAQKKLGVAANLAAAAATTAAAAKAAGDAADAVISSIMKLQSKRADKLKEEKKLLENNIKLSIEEERIAKELLEYERNITKEIKLSSGYIAHLKDSSKDILAIFGGISGKMQTFVSSLKTIPKRFLLINLLIEEGLRRFVLLDQTAESFRRETGYTADQMANVRKNAESLNVEFANMGVTIEAAYKSAKALTDVFGRTSLVTREAMQNIALMKANLNVSEEDSANVLATFQGLGGVSQTVAMNIMKVGASFSGKIGVPFQSVMHDIANASEETLALLGANPNVLMKSAISARIFGTDLNKLASTQKRLLDYNSSITKEMAAGALLGRDISFQKAREYAYEGKIAKSTESILETVKSIGDFNALDVYQKQALAEATEMELKDLSKMMAIESQREKIRFSGTKEEREKLADQEKALKTLEAQNDLSNAGLLIEGERAIRQQQMQGLLTRMTDMLQAVLVSIGDILEPIITPIVSILLPVLRGVAWIIKGIAFAFKVLVFPINLAVDAIKSFAESSQWVGDTIEWVGEAIESVSKIFKDTFGGAENWIKGIAGSAGLIALLFFGRGGISGMLGKLKGGIGSAFKFMLSPIKSIKSMFEKKDFIGPMQPKIAPSSLSNTDKLSTSGKNVKSGTGIKDFLTNLADGLKKMGGTGVFKGAVNLLIASPGLVTIIPGALLSGLIPKNAGKNIENFLSGLANGLKNMGTGRITAGAANLLLSSLGLVAIIPGAIAASILGVIGKPIATGLKYLAKGVGYMADRRVFAGALAITAVGASIIPFTVAMSMFSSVDWTNVGVGTLALVGFTAAAFGLGALLSSGYGGAIFVAGVIGIAALGLALIPFGIAAMAAGKGIQYFAKGIQSSLAPIEKLKNVNLGSTAVGIGALGVALTAFGYGSVAAGLGSFVGTFLGGDPISKMERLASIGDKLQPVANSIKDIGIAVGAFSSVNSFSDAIVKLADSIGKLNDQLKSVNTESLNKLSAISSATGTATSKETKQTGAVTFDTSALEAKFDTLIGMMVDGKIVASVDLDKLSSRSARKS